MSLFDAIKFARWATYLALTMQYVLRERVSGPLPPEVRRRLQRCARKTAIAQAYVWRRQQERISQ